MHNPPLILVVDDTPSDAILLSRAMGKAGYQTHLVGDGREVVAKALELLPDLIFMDIMLPGLDGLQACRSLKTDERTALIPVIFVTGSTNTSDIISSFEAGGSDHVCKPIHVDEVLARVSMHLRLRQAEQNLIERNEQLQTLGAQLAETNTELARQTRVDALTGLLNRGAWDESARLEQERSDRHQHTYSLLMLDVDSFKAFNDSKGHQAGDECLKSIGKRIAASSRATDILARYGGEEFVVLAPETPVRSAVLVAERIRQSVWDLALPHPASAAGRVTVSIGVAESTVGPLCEVVRQADAALYRAKKCGRNLVCTADGMIPALPEEAANSADRSADDLALCRPPRVLIVEDNRTNRMVYKGCLAKDGYEILEAENGQEALDIIEARLPDAIIMDIMMPVMDGLECTRRLKENPATREIPVIIVSARTDPLEILQGLDAGADEYMTKPIRTTELMVRVRSMCRLSRERKDLLRSYNLRAEQVRVLSVLVDLCQAVGTATDSDDAIVHAINAVAELALSRQVSVLSPDAQKQNLVIARSIGLPDNVPVTFPIKSSIVGKVFETRQPVVLNAPSSDAGQEGTWSSTLMKTPAMCVPLGSGSDILGVLNVADRLEKRPFTQREQEYVSLVANIVGSSLQALRHRAARDEARDMIVVALAKLAEHRDNDTARHVDRVTLYSCVLAEKLRSYERFRGQIDEQFLFDLQRAVPLHDIGKVAIPDGILRKPGRLSVEEMAIMRKHAEIGADTLRPIMEKVPDAHFLFIAEQVIRSHHEWYDGSGYPNGLAGDQIPLAARITALADVYDALTTDRVYKVAVSHEKAEKIILSASGTQFDPDIVAAFVATREDFLRLGAELADSGRGKALRSADQIDAKLVPTSS